MSGHVCLHKQYQRRLMTYEGHEGLSYFIGEHLTTTPCHHSVKSKRCSRKQGVNSSRELFKKCLQTGPAPNGSPTTLATCHPLQNCVIYDEKHMCVYIYIYTFLFYFIIYIFLHSTTPYSVSLCLCLMGSVVFVQ